MACVLCLFLTATPNKVCWGTECLSKALKRQPLTHPTHTYPYTIITAASDNHLCALENFLYKLNHHRSRFAPSQFPRIVVYQLGIQPTRLPILHQLVRNGKINDLVEFNYTRYPSFWNVTVKRGEYAWKTGILDEVRMKYGGILVWLDAGNIVTSDFLRRIPTIIQRQGGFWSPRSQWTAKRWTHPGMYEYFQVTPFLDAENCNGAALGFDANNKTIVDTLMIPWRECAQVKQCIAPPGSSRANHRQDQAVITYLAHQHGHECKNAPSVYQLKLHKDASCWSDLLELKRQKKLKHPSFIDG
ncbi:hypothetical protein BDF14DRAFT_1885642 [Spinellus fusiger]|nr:hypothetical protein BDF14DRAFT_1885642 [Spinellus fusiger]